MVSNIDFYGVRKQFLCCVKRKCELCSRATARFRALFSQDKSRILWQCLSFPLIIDFMEYKWKWKPDFKEFKEKEEKYSEKSS